MDPVRILLMEDTPLRVWQARRDFEKKRSTFWAKVHLIAAVAGLVLYKAVLA